MRIDPCLTALGFVLEYGALFVPTGSGHVFDYDSVENRWRLKVSEREAVLLPVTDRIQFYHPTSFRFALSRTQDAAPTRTFEEEDVKGVGREEGKRPRFDVALSLARPGQRTLLLAGVHCPFEHVEIELACGGDLVRLPFTREGMDFLGPAHHPHIEAFHRLFFQGSATGETLRLSLHPRNADA